MRQAKAQALLAEALTGPDTHPSGSTGAGTCSIGTASDGAPTPTPAGAPDLSVQAYRTLVALRQWLCTSACDGMDLPQIAQHAGLSMSYLRRHFPAVAAGQSVMGWVRARSALEREGVCIARAAEISGYRSSTHFAKAFRQAYGCPPSLWCTRA